jgi:two-component system, sporulation sensor kinase E
LASPLERSSCQAIVQSLPGAVLLVDAELRVVLANRAASRLFRISPDRMRGVSITTLIPVPELATWLRDFGARRMKMFETTLTSRKRRHAPRTVKITAVRMAATAGSRREPSSSRSRQLRLLLLEDISDRVILETQLVQTEKQAAMGQLAAGLLHEVRNPVASLGSNLLFAREKLAHAKAADPEIAQAVAVSLEQLDQMRQLLGTLSAFPRRSPLQYVRADLHDLVRQSVRFVAKEAESRGIQLTVTFAPVAITCEMDVRMIKQVLLNLLKNAIEAMPSGGRLAVRTSYRDQSGDTAAAAVIEIVDTGVGISEADLRLVFRPLFSTKPRGTGLGLSFCRQAVEEHGGEIRLASGGRDRGTIATVSLPVYQSTDDSARSEPK